MKAAIVIFLLIFIFTAIAWIGATEMLDRNRVQQSTIDGLRKQNKKESDSLNQVLKVTQDSLLIAFETIKQARIEREESHLRTQKTIKDLQKIVYIQHTDSSRNKALTQLYKTYQP